MRRHVFPTLRASTINRLAWIILAVLVAAASVRAEPFPKVAQHTTAAAPVKPACAGAVGGV